ncbi:MAG: radical SAM protein [Candidatus Altiarchaeota archaeon]
MKVLLVNPPTDNMIQPEVPSVVNEERGFNPPLGLLYVASTLLREGHEVGVFDMPTEGAGHGELEARLERDKPDVVGFTVMSFTLIDVMIASKTVKEYDSRIKVVWGGPHVNIYPEESARLPDVDYIALGEGELTMPRLLDGMGDTRRLQESAGIVFKKDGRVVNTGNPWFINNLDGIPFPARRLTPYKKYSSLLAKRSPITTMITSRGCPDKCLFCDRPHLGKMFRARSARNVVDEMQECFDMGVREFLIYDDTFTIDRQRVLEICGEIRERGLDIGWDVRARVNTVDKEMLKTMREAGCERIHFGVEAGNEEILRILRKGITREQAVSAFKDARDAGMETLAYFMIGSPRETRDTIKESIEFAKQLKPDYVHFSVTTPFPGTDLYRMGLDEGVLERDFWREFAVDPTPGYTPPLWEENMRREELISLLNLAYKSFYTRPSYAVKELMRVRSPAELFRKIKAGVKLVARVF